MRKLFVAVLCLLSIGCSTSRAPDPTPQKLVLSYSQEWAKLQQAGEIPEYVKLRTSSGQGSAQWENGVCEIQLPRNSADTSNFVTLANSTSPSMTALFVIAHELGHCRQFKEAAKEVLLPQEKEAAADLHALAVLRSKYSMSEYLKFYTKLIQFREQAQVYGGRGQIYRRSNARDTARYLRSAAI